MSHTEELICRQLFRKKKHNILQGGSNFCILFLKNKYEEQLEPDLSEFNYFVHVLLQLNLLALSLFSSVHNLYLCPTNASLCHKP